jgi:hypothetical protein
MIKENTLFILGSGASKPYGYPTGEELIKEIKDYFPVFFKKLSIPEEKEVNYSLAKEFVSELMMAHDNMIDYFLATSKPQNTIIGKMAILFIIHLKEQISFKKEIEEIPKDDWFRLLIREMTKHLIKGDQVKYFQNNKVNFITFNYDRLLEHFMGNTLQHKFSSTKRDVKGLMGNIQILHLFGRLPELPWENLESGLEYGANIDYEYLRNNAERIKTIHERTVVDYERINFLIRNADRIFFLGFGFHEENLALLSLEKNIFKPTSIYATAFGNNDEQIEKLSLRICPDIIYDGSQFGIRVKKIIEPIKSRELLEKYL